jgi:radical SAM protein with 4Fe4S-binding SPASM domain
MLIDGMQLQSAWENEGFYSLQLEVGDRCHQGCIYCYMNAIDEGRNTLSDPQIELLLRDAYELGITAIEWLGGEPLLRESVFRHLALAEELGFRNNVWTGGLPLSDRAVRIATTRYAKRGLISIHISTINEALYKTLHPSRPPSDLWLIIESVREVLKMGYPPSQMLNSVTFTGLQDANDMIRTIDYFEEEFGIKTSLNVYHTYLRPGIPEGEMARFIPPAHEVELVYRRYGEQWGVDRMPMNCVNKQYCSSTIAVLCDGSVTPCATIREKGAPNIHASDSLLDIARRERRRLIFAKFRERRNLPADCQRCRILGSCFGCRSRSYAAGRGLYGKDPMCVWTVKKKW